MIFLTTKLGDFAFSSSNHFWSLYTVLVIQSPVERMQGTFIDDSHSVKIIWIVIKFNLNSQTFIEWLGMGPVVY